MTLNIKDSTGVWREAKEVYVLVNGQWQLAREVYVKSDAQWRQGFVQTTVSPPPPDPEDPNPPQPPPGPYDGQKTFDIRDYGALTTRSNNRTYIQAALDAAAAYANSSRRAVVVVPPGTWVLQTADTSRRNLLIGSYVTFWCQEGAVLKFTASTAGAGGDCHLIASHPDLDMNGYNGPQQVIIDGGEWDGTLFTKGMALAHCNGLTIKNLTIKDSYGNGHGIEINSSQNVLIDNVKMLGVRDAGGGKAERDYDEAIQLDYAWDGATIYSGDDGTPCKNVTVQNCTFGRSGTAGSTVWPRAIGTHNAGANSNRHRYIYIRNNTIVGCNGVDGGAIRVFNMYDVEVSGNTLSKCFRAINAYITDSNKASGNISRLDRINIQSNTIDNCGAWNDHDGVFQGIDLNVNNSVTARFYTVNVLNNTITNHHGSAGSYGIRVTEADTVVIKGNYVPNRHCGTDKANMIRGKDSTITGTWTLTGNTPDNT